MTDLYDPAKNTYGHDIWMKDMSSVGGAITFTDRIDFFDETPNADFLSNFYPSPIRLDLGYGRILYATGEHAYQAAKARNEDAHLKIALCESPGASKMLGNACDLRPDWESAKAEVMRSVLAAKFPTDYRNPLSQRLVGTGSAMLIEGTNWNDKIWGVAYDARRHTIEGRNLLGVQLMERRGVLNAGARGQL